MTGSDTPLYESGPSIKSMGNTYLVFADRIELRCRFPFVWKTLVIQKEDLVSIAVFRPPVIKTVFWALKLDLADLNEHVGLIRKNGVFKQLRFTPQHPHEFVAKVTDILNPPPSTK